MTQNVQDDGVRERVEGAIPTRHRMRSNAQTVDQAFLTDAASQVTAAWTPTDASGAGLGLTINNAYYARIGSLVFAFFNLTYPATASGATAKIGGLPLTQRTSSVIIHPVLLAQITAAITRGYVHPTEGSMRFYNAGGTVDMLNSGMSTHTVQGCAVYQVV